MESAMNELRESVSQLELKVQVASTNASKRRLHSESELLLIKAKELFAISPHPILSGLQDQLKNISTSLSLSHVVREFPPVVRFLHKIDGVLRMIAVWLVLALASVFFAIPCILLSPVDFIFVKIGLLPVQYQISVLCKLFLARVLLKVAGIHIVIEGLDREQFGKQCVLACFSHSSSLDAFLISAAIPVTALTICKKELFLIPFFSWCASAFGGVPINRENRDQAVKSMEAAASAAKLGECMAISPEGTRSLNGQLLDFKKGPFYLWEKLQTPIIPIITIGAFELFPPGFSMTLPGKVYVRFLPPIMPSEAHGKDTMGKLVRLRMLEAIKESPEDAACPLTWPQRLNSWLHMGVIYAIVWHLYHVIVQHDLERNWALSYAQLWALFGAFSVLITLLFYVHAVYCAPIVRDCVGNKLVRKLTSAV